MLIEIRLLRAPLLYIKKNVYICRKIGTMVVISSRDIAFLVIALGYICFRLIQAIINDLKK